MIIKFKLAQSKNRSEKKLPQIVTFLQLTSNNMIFNNFSPSKYNQLSVSQCHSLQETFEFVLNGLTQLKKFLLKQQSIENCKTSPTITGMTRSNQVKENNPLSHPANIIIIPVLILIITYNHQQPVLFFIVLIIKFDTLLINPFQIVYSFVSFRHDCYKSNHSVNLE